MFYLSATGALGLGSLKENGAGVANLTGKMPSYSRSIQCQGFGLGVDCSVLCKVEVEEGAVAGGQGR